MRDQILCSTGAFVGRVNGRDHRIILRTAPLLHCDGLEFMMYEAWYDRWREIAADLASSGLSFPVLHADKRIGELFSRNEGEDIREGLRRFAVNCQMAQALGAKKLVVHLWGGPPSDRDIATNIAQLPELSRMSEDAGLLLTVENVVCSHQDPLTHLRTLAERYPRIHFTFDTKMAAFHRQLEEVYRPEWDWLWSQRRIAHLHVNDYGGGYMDWSNLRTLHIGDGAIPFDRFFAVLRQKGYHGSYTVEATSMTGEGILLDKLNGCLEYIRRQLQMDSLTSPELKV